MSRRFVPWSVAALLLAVLGLSALPAARPAEKESAAGFPRFAVREIEKGLGVGYAVLLVDLNGDGKKDVVVVDTTRVVWYENPTWKRRTIIEGKTRPDNVCIAAHDIDGDGRLDLALGSGWNGLKTGDAGTLQWLQRGRTLDDPWIVHPIDDVPWIHRIRFIDLEGTGKPSLVVAPLMGRHSTPARNWMDGEPVRLVAYQIPRDPVRERWPPEVLDETQHVMHNFCPVPAAGGQGQDVLTASYVGVSLVNRHNGQWTRHLLGVGNQENPRGSRGASEIKQGRLRGGRPFLAAIEPWHGYQVVVYTLPADNQGHWRRHVIDDKLRWGHAVWCADLDGDGNDELIVGVRDNLSNRPGERCGVRIYKAADDHGERWERHLVDEGGVAVEDLAAADLDGDGKIDVVAVGRASHNVRIYRNLGKK